MIGSLRRSSQSCRTGREVGELGGDSDAEVVTIGGFPGWRIRREHSIPRGPRTELRPETCYSIVVVEPCLAIDPARTGHRLVEQRPTRSLAIVASSQVGTAEIPPPAEYQVDLQCADAQRTPKMAFIALASSGTRFLEGN